MLKWVYLMQGLIFLLVCHLLCISDKDAHKQAYALRYQDFCGNTNKRYTKVKNFIESLLQIAVVLGLIALAAYNFSEIDYKYYKYYNQPHYFVCTPSSAYSEQYLLSNGEYSPTNRYNDTILVRDVGDIPRSGYQVHGLLTSNEEQVFIVSQYLTFSAAVTCVAGALAGIAAIYLDRLELAYFAKLSQCDSNETFLLEAMR